MVTVGYSRLQQITELLQWVTAGYRVVTVGYSRLPSGYGGLQWVSAGYSKLQQVTEW